jgi:hypothetical protein
VMPQSRIVLRFFSFFLSMESHLVQLWFEEVKDQREGMSWCARSHNQVAPVCPGLPM